MKRFVSAFEKGAALMVFLIVWAARLIILPIHLITFTIERGCFTSIQYMTELQQATIEKLKEE